MEVSGYRIKSDELDGTKLFNVILLTEICSTASVYGGVGVNSVLRDREHVGPNTCVGLKVSVIVKI